MDVIKQLEKLKNQERQKYVIPERDMKQIVNKCKEILAQESNVQPICAPVNICGDIHGQFFDLLNIFDIAGQVQDGTNYVFMGDFVDRGYNSVETIEYLICLKVAFPDRITLIRGNHESRQITQAYGFLDEIQKKYGNSNVWNILMDLFDYLPISALVEGTVFCVHGGLSPEIKTIDQIRTINRKQEIPIEGPFTDLMWSDPDDCTDLWATSQRGAGWIFGKKVVADFNEINGLELICRAHQLAEEGYDYKFDNSLVTVWSAPNYCNRMGNKAVILKFDEHMNRSEEIFEEVRVSDDFMVPRGKLLPYFL